MAACLCLDVIRFNAAISASEKGGQWQPLVPWCGEMRREGLSRDMIRFNAAISSCKKGGQRQPPVP
eukprot:11647830-Karenia_brevis.AAC.1